ncbi:hypothetical protein [Undibacterium sp.]|uniref:hypothetical protein n=1 Tax=Undibacterium sp. TaxID=1914977 RepID=UPI00375336CB
MENNTNNVNDLITQKFDDNEAMQIVVQRAVTEAVEKARKLGFLKSHSVQEDAIEYKTD